MELDFSSVDIPRINDKVSGINFKYSWKRSENNYPEDVIVSFLDFKRKYEFNKDHKVNG